MAPTATDDRTWPRRLALAALLAAALIPLWVGAYPPSYDYPAHLLEAQVALRYGDPAWGYAEGYQLLPGWQGASNAVAPLLMVGLATALPIDLAGRLVLSLAVALTLTGVWRLLGRAGALALAPAALPLAYSLALTSGWVNFALALGLGAHAMALAAGWGEGGGRRRLGLLALLSGLMAAAHPVAWALWAVAIGVSLGWDGPWRRGAAAAAALAAPLALALPARPGLALACGAILALAWGAALAARRLGLRARPLLLAAPPAAAALFLGAAALRPALAALDPELAYSRFARLSFPMRALALPSQAMPPEPALVATNLALLAALGGLALALAWGVARRPAGPREGWLAALAALALIYGLAPSRSADIDIVEARVVLVAALLGLGCAGLPAGPWARRLAVGLAGAAGAVGAVGTLAYAVSFSATAAAWQRDLAPLEGARRVLSIHAANPADYGAGMPLTALMNLNDGAYFSTYRFVEEGGFTTRIFGNGPIWWREGLPGWVYYYPQSFRSASRVAEQCALARSSFDAVLAWGALPADLEAQLAACLGPPVRSGPAAIWRLAPTRPSARP